MSLALIQESAKEVRRLAIAGSSLAVGDFRLKKLVAPLEQAGAKVPVFAQVAKAIDELVNGTEADSATRLLNLSTLLNAILYTQGQAGAEGAFAPLESFATKCTSTRTTARTLKPIVEALTTTGGGRFEVVKTAHERGLFNDLRLIDPAIHALGDKYPELADYVAEKVLPGYGPGIVPRLKQQFDLKGKGEDGRRLTVMHQLDPQGTLDLCKSALEDGSADVKAAAVLCLGKHPDCVPLLLEQAASKNKAVRSAALQALAEHDRGDITQVFLDLIKGKSLDILAAPFRKLRNREVLRALIDEGQRVLQTLVKGDSDQIPRMLEILNCIGGRKDAPVEEFLAGVAAVADKLVKLKPPKNQFFGGEELVTQAVALLYGIGSPAAFETILRHRSLLSGSAFGWVLRSARRTWSAAKFYEEFSPLLGAKKGADKGKSQELQTLITAANWNKSSRFHWLGPDAQDDDGDEPTAEWDQRWLDAAIQADLHPLVCVLARPGHSGAADYLLKTADGKDKSDAGLIVHALARCQHPKATDVFLDFVTKKTKGARYLDYDLQFLFESAKYLPAADLPKLDATAAKLDEKFVEPFLEALAPLRPAAQAS